nr:hypothetical protein [Tanacetum cinerariifolium]
METSSQPLSDDELWILVMRPDVDLTRGMMNGENNVLVAIENNGFWWRVTNNVTVEGSNLVVGGDPKYQDAGSTQSKKKSINGSISTCCTMSTNFFLICLFAQFRGTDALEMKHNPYQSEAAIEIEMVKTYEC